MCAARYTFGCVLYTFSCHDLRQIGDRPQILWRHGSQPTPDHGRRRFLRPQLYTWRAGPCQYRQYQLDVSTHDSYVAMTLTDFSSVGIVIIAIVSLLVSDCSPLCLRLFLITSTDRCPFVGSGLLTGEYCLSGTYVRPPHCPDII